MAFHLTLRGWHQLAASKFIGVDGNGDGNLGKHLRSSATRASMSGAIGARRVVALSSAWRWRQTAFPATKTGRQRRQTLPQQPQPHPKHSRTKALSQDPTGSKLLYRYQERPATQDARAMPSRLARTRPRKHNREPPADQESSRMRAMTIASRQQPSTDYRRSTPHR
ncbi:hypothetical protein Strop_1059 [Salinispora tropica CNB-440]|uniref:Uncharacterized protein n=1 Tax=Salinispora tropica (strain ATCC BAA-916 / DSM 44818 / JCM 13857 / NBRC 105044 / CNB-440) TaxID=369723 RepID=A4X3T2_SALTO|nr:hypothetical protein Strop_1059 [Salinispora tropica CNB-440]